MDNQQNIPGVIYNPMISKQSKIDHMKLTLRRLKQTKLNISQTIKDITSNNTIDDERVRPMLDTIINSQLDQMKSSLSTVDSRINQIEQMLKEVDAND